MEYISRSYFLTPEEFEQKTLIDQTLVDLLKQKYGEHSLEEFGAATYEGDYASIFFEYWRSFLAISKIVMDFDGNIPAVFRSYRQWGETERETPLTEWFHVSI